MASNTTKAVLFHDARPEAGKVPVYSTNRWSYYSTAPLQITAPTPRMFVSSDYGSGDKQEDLKQAFIDGNPDGRHVVMYIDVVGYEDQLVTQFQEAFEEVARKYVNETLHPSGSKGKKRGPSLTLSSLLSDNSKGGKSFKVKVTDEVLKDMYESIPDDHRGETRLNLPKDSTFKFALKITGIWHNSSQYGFTIKLGRGMWVKTCATAKAVKPEDYEFIDESDREEGEINPEEFEAAQRLDY